MAEWLIASVSKAEDLLLRRSEGSNPSPAATLDAARMVKRETQET